MATAPSANDLTRQQLDELDALLQRMLALPLNAPDGPPAAAPFTPDALPVPNWRADPPAAPPSPPHFVPPPRQPAPPAPEPVVRAKVEPAFVPDAPTPPPEPAIPITRWKAPDPAPVPAPAPAPPKPAALPPVTVAPVVVAPAPAPVPPPPRPPLPVPLLLWPFVAFNWVVDAVLGLFGPPGRLLRSGFGKNVLGLAGVGQIAYTAAHVASVQGWVTLPFALPWPRRM